MIIFLSVRAIHPCCDQHLQQVNKIVGTKAVECVSTTDTICGEYNAYLTLEGSMGIMDGQGKNPMNNSMPSLFLQEYPACFKTERLSLWDYPEPPAHKVLQLNHL